MAVNSISAYRAYRPLWALWAPYGPYGLRCKCGPPTGPISPRVLICSILAYKVSELYAGPEPQA